MGGCCPDIERTPDATATMSPILIIFIEVSVGDAITSRRNAAGLNGANTVTRWVFSCDRFNLTDTVTFLPAQSADGSLSASHVALLYRDD